MFLSYYIGRSTFSDVNFRTKFNDLFIEKGTDVQPDVETSSQQVETPENVEDSKVLAGTE